MLNAELQLIDDDILIFGYVRQEIENKLSMTIPNVIKVISYQFWKEMWDNTTCSSNIEISQDGIVKHKQKGKGIVYGQKIIERQETTIWKLKILNWTTKTISDYIKIGIVNYENKTKQWYPGAEMLCRDWKIEDKIEYDSDPENELGDGRNHIHKGMVFAVNKNKSQSGKMMLKLEDTGLYCHCSLGAIKVKLPPFIIGIEIGHVSREKHIYFDAHDIPIWTCSRCTYRNIEKEAYCSMCILSYNKSIPDKSIYKIRSTDNSFAFNDKFDIIGDTITMILNTKECTLQFEINGIDVGMINIMYGAKYTLAVEFNE